jgi:hypothetical protein
MRMYVEFLHLCIRKRTENLCACVVQLRAESKAQSAKMSLDKPTVTFQFDDLKFFSGKGPLPFSGIRQMSIISPLEMVGTHGRQSSA